MTASPSATTAASRDRDGGAAAPAGARTGVGGAAVAHAAVPTSSPASSRSLLRDAFEAFDGAGIRWLVLRDELRLDEPDGEVDLLVDPADVPMLEDDLLGLGFVRLRTQGRGSHRQYLGHGGDARPDWIRLDVVTELAFGPFFALRGPDVSGVMARRARLGGLPVLGAGDAFFALLLHSLLDGPEIRPTRREDLHRLAPAATALEPWRSLLGSRSGDGDLLDALLAAVRSDAWDWLRSVAPAITRRLLRRDLPIAARRIAAGWLARRVESFTMRLQHPGLTVTLVGTDGAGKSAVASALLARSPIPARTVYLGLWRRPVGSGSLGIPGMDLARRVGLAWRQYLVGRYHAARGRLVVFDRYTFDAGFALARARSPRDRLYYGVVARSLPAPDLVVVLDLPGSVAHARKGEHDPETLEAQRQAYLELAQHGDAAVVDATRPHDEVLAAVEELVWRQLVRRWRW